MNTVDVVFGSLLAILVVPDLYRWRRRVRSHPPGPNRVSAGGDLSLVPPTTGSAGESLPHWLVHEFRIRRAWRRYERARRAKDLTPFRRFP